MTTLTMPGLPQKLADRYQSWRQQRSALQQDWRTVRWLAVDLETNGLDCGPEGILSIAWVPMQGGVIGMGEARYHVIRTDVPLNQSVVHHHLTTGDIAEGADLRSVMAELAAAMTDAVLVAHHAGLDWRLLKAAGPYTGVAADPLAVVDTLQLERRRNAQRYQHDQMGATPFDAYTLAACRQRHDLPTRTAHHALEDAVACAELFLAQAWKLAGSGSLTASQLVRQGRPA